MGDEAAVSFRFTVMALLAVLGSACGSRGVQPDSLPSEASRSASGQPPAIAFFNHPLIDGLALSPDGEHIAGIASQADKELVLVRKTMGGELRGLAEVVRERKTKAMTISGIGWPSNDRLVMVVEEPLRQSTNHARRDRLFSVDLYGEVRYLAANWYQSTQIYSQGQIITWLPDDPRHVLVGVILAGETYPSVLRVNVATGGYRVVHEPTWGISSYYADSRGDVRAAFGFGKPRGAVRSDKLFNVLLARVDPRDRFHEVIRWNPLVDGGFWFAAFTPDPEVIYAIIGTDDGDRSSVFPFDLTTGEFGNEGFEHPVVDVTDIAVSKFDGRPLYVELDFERPEIVYIDERLASLQRRVDAALPDRVNRFVDYNRDETRFIVRSWSDIVPPEYYVFNGGRPGLLFQAYPDLAGARLSPMIPVEYQSRDGLTIRGYWTRPVDAPDGPLPTIVLPHGGPWARDLWGWDAEAQFLASRGFAVFQPNFRGSTGYGHAFTEAGYGEWGLAMQDDITDGVHWLIAEGMADPERIGIFGMSYGGYAALQGLASTPELYKAGASLSGVSDVRMFMADVSKNLRHADLMVQLVGDRRADKDKLSAASPAHNAHEIRVPVMLGHGTRDWNVSVDHSKNMARALKKNGVPVELYIYEDEPHEFLDDRNRAHFFEHLADFFERHLAVRATN